MRYDWKDIEPKMLGNWQAAIMSIVNVDSMVFNGKHQPCPSCSGKDRYRFDDNFETKGDGGAICNQCGSGSGMNWLMKLSGMNFPEALEALGGFLNMNPREKLKAISAVLDAPPLPQDLRDFLERAAAYTLTPGADWIGNDHGRLCWAPFLGGLPIDQHYCQCATGSFWEQ